MPKASFGANAPSMPASRRSFLTTAAAAGAALISAPALSVAVAGQEDPLLAMVRACQGADAAYSEGLDRIYEIQDLDARKAAERKLYRETIGPAYKALESPPVPTTLAGAMSVLALMRDSEMDCDDLNVPALMDALLTFFRRQSGEVL